MRFAALIAVLVACVSLIAAPVPPPGDNSACEEALRRATDVLATVEVDGEECTILWCAVAELQAKLGKADAARDSLAKARKVAEKFRSAGGEDEWAVAAIGRAAGRLGEKRAILDLIASIPAEKESRRESLYRDAALAAADFGHA